MITKAANAIKNFIFARASVCAKIFVLAFVCITSSTGLIFADKKIKFVAPATALDRWNANRDLAKREVSGVEATLIASLNDPEPMVRQGAAQELGKYAQNPAVVHALSDTLLNEKAPAVRYACALSLGLSPTFRAIRALEKVAADPDANLRRQVAYSLQLHRKGQNKRKAEELLKKLRRDSDASVRTAAGEGAR